MLGNKTYIYIYMEWSKTIKNQEYGLSFVLLGYWEKLGENVQAAWFFPWSFPKEQAVISTHPPA